MKIKFFKNPRIKNILSALFIAGFGFIFLNVTFMFDYFYQSLVRGIIQLFLSVDIFSGYAIIPPIMHISFVLIIGIITRFIFISKLETLVKATFMTVPLTVVFVTIGMFLFRWPLVGFVLGSCFTLGVFYYLYRTKQPWLY